VRRLGIAVTLLALGGCATASAPPPPGLAADAAGRLPVSVGSGASQATLSGVLTLPKGETPAPAVVLMHGCSGVTRTVRDWATALRDWGHVTFVLDSFGGRGISSVCESGALRSDARVDDAYAALAMLAGHPRVDPGRIVLMGFSHGGGVALLAAAQWVSRAHVSPGSPRFRAFVAFYPRCEGRHPGTLAGPLRVHIGALDDWTPASPCEVMIDSLRGRAADARITVYEGAHHGFDGAQLPAERWLPNVQAPHGRRGATIGHNPEALRRARENVRRELAEILGP
jgi:dienelactone hydrolase